MNEVNYSHIACRAIVKNFYFFLNATHLEYNDYD